MSSKVKEAVERSNSVSILVKHLQLLLRLHSQLFFTLFNVNAIIHSFSLSFFLSVSRPLSLSVSYSAPQSLRSAIMSYHILFFGMEYAENEEIVEYGALKVSTHSLTTIEEYHSFIQPSLQTINNFKERTRLTRENLTRAYTFSTIHLSLFELLNDQIWIGYNIDSIHYPRLKKACEYQNLLCPIPRQTIDTRLLWTLDFEEGKDVSLQSLGNHFGIEEQEQHLSIPDCHLNLKVFIRCGGRHILNEFMKEGV